ncbi:LysR substrate-binding domain-containing protein [Brenneria corticis]|uniref:LysR family transcriptional regulator n=1 Tax=Brenneria corticis TaxID=2173106 RepID=A0A2U1TP77_9GAMM|nr:LysR substrate-binding domain-containing protein [Brenneria sp. CFCC 11842]PWC11208.1 LysR family transcriptional regulator [Brenneria sp. CFCC 11842]
MTKKLPPLNLLHTFDVVGKRLSMTEAARDLHLTHGAISKQIKALEAHLGFPLIERDGRGIRLTAQGRELHPACSRAVALVSAAIDKLSSQPDAPLTVSCEPTLCMRFLIPRLPAFKQAHPDIDIHLLAAGGNIDLAQSRVDMALRRDDFVFDERYFSQRIIAEYTAPVCSIRQEHSERLSTYLHTASRPDAWKIWQAQASLPRDHQAAQHRYFEHFYLTLQAAESGLGVAIASLFMVEQELTDGRLATLAPFQPDGSQYILLSARPIDGDRRYQAFRDWLIAEMADVERRFSGLKT